MALRKGKAEGYMYTFVRDIKNRYSVHQFETKLREREIGATDGVPSEYF